MQQKDKYFNEYKYQKKEKIMLQSCEEKQKYHVTAHFGLHNLVGVFETVKRCWANDIDVCNITHLQSLRNTRII